MMTFLWVRVLTQTLKRRLADVAIRCPFRKSDLAEQLGPDPCCAFHDIPWTCGDERYIRLDLREPVMELLRGFHAEARTGFPRIFHEACLFTAQLGRAPSSSSRKS